LCRGKVLTIRCVQVSRYFTSQLLSRMQQCIRYSTLRGSLCGQCLQRLTCASEDELKSTTSCEVLIANGNIPAATHLPNKVENIYQSHAGYSIYCTMVPGIPSPQIAPFRGSRLPSNILYGSFGPPESTFQTAPRSV